MPYNGSGIFNQIYNWVTDKANGVLVTAGRFQATYDDMAQALSNGMTRDGQSPALADIPMGGFKITGMAAGVSANDAVNRGQLSPTAFTAKTIVRVRPSVIYGQVAGEHPVTLDSIVVDTLTEFAANKFTALNAGFYQVNYQIFVAPGISSSTLFYITRVFRNGTVLIGGDTTRPNSFAANAFDVGQGTFIVGMAAGDTISMTLEVASAHTVYDSSILEILRIG
jgi:hypothetical protein